MRIPLLLAAGVVACAVAPTAIAQCVRSEGYAAGTAASIGVKVGSGWTENGKQAPPLSSAVEMWAGCSESAQGFAQFVANGNGDFNILVNYVASAMPDRGQASFDSCAWFDPELNSNGQVSGGTIDVFARTTNGGDCLWVQPHAILDNIIAHELGHVLGLANSTCPDYLMGPDVATAGVNAQECSWVAQSWETEAEQDQQTCNATCSVPCTGTPPSCNTSSEGGGDGGPGCPWYDCSPLILDLNGDGIHTTSVAEPVLFDLTGDGVPERLGWTNPATEEAFLWVDLSPNGRVDGGRELFGNGTALANGQKALDGFQALSEYDRPFLGGNGDHRLSDVDRVWNRLRLWVDANHDGVCTPAESGPVAEYGVVEIELAYTVHHEVDANGNAHRLRSSYTRMVRKQGQPRLERFVLHDVFFRSLPP